MRRCVSPSLPAFGKPTHHSAFDHPLHINQQVVALAANLKKALDHCSDIANSVGNLPVTRESTQRKGDDSINAAMESNQARKLFVYHPINLTIG